MHAAFTRDPKHGMSMMALADFARLGGIDTLHIGTGIGKLEGKIEEIEAMLEKLEEDSKEEMRANTPRVIRDRVNFLLDDWLNLL